MRKYFFALLIIFSLSSFASQDLYPFETEKQSLRFQQLTQNFRCLVCQNQSIADSDAPLANDMRKEVYKQVLLGKNDKDIEKYLIERFGSFVVFTPPVVGHTYLLWGLPFILLFVGFFVVLNIVRKAKRAV